MTLFFIFQASGKQVLESKCHRDCVDDNSYILLVLLQPPIFMLFLAQL